jgi:hypothetical protein
MSAEIKNGVLEIINLENEGGCMKLQKYIFK